MKKILLLFAAFCFAIAGNAQFRTYQSNDANQDGIVDISDVNHIIGEICGSEKSGPIITVDSMRSLLYDLDANVAMQVERKLGLSDEPGTPGANDHNLLLGKFSVSDTKQVQFTKSNLYWDGSALKFEANQTDSPTSWDPDHVGHFMWTNITDYKSGNANNMPYAECVSDDDEPIDYESIDDAFWCGVDNPLTVEGTSGLYVLTSQEFLYLIENRNNASSLCKYDVTVTNNGKSYAGCMIIAPDDFVGTLKSSYTLDELNAAGLVCLPASGFRDWSIFYETGWGHYWTASTNDDLAYYFFFDREFSYHNGYRYKGRSLRLVKTI